MLMMDDIICDPDNISAMIKLFHVVKFKPHSRGQMMPGRFMQTSPGKRTTECAQKSEDQAELSRQWATFAGWLIEPAL